MARELRTSSDIGSYAASQHASPGPSPLPQDGPTFLPLENIKYDALSPSNRVYRYVDNILGRHLHDRRGRVHGSAQWPTSKQAFDAINGDVFRANRM
jgi:hypothetical protein